MEFMAYAGGDDGQHDPSLELRGVKDITKRFKITDVWLIRSGSDRGLDFEVLKQYDGMTENISYNTNHVVYLLWKTINTRYD